MKSKPTIKQMEEAVECLKTAKSQCPKCKKWFGSNPKLSGWVIKGKFIELWCKKCWNNLKIKDEK